MAEDMYYLIFVCVSCFNLVQCLNHLKSHVFSMKLFQYTNSSRAGVILCSCVHLWYLLKWLIQDRYRTFTDFHQHMYLSPASTPIQFSFPPFTASKTQRSYLIPILHMHNIFFPFMPFQGHHSSSFLSLSYIITLNSPKNHLSIICCFQSQFLKENSLNSTFSYQLKSFSVQHCVPELLERYSYLRFLLP